MNLTRLQQVLSLSVRLRAYPSYGEGTESHTLAGARDYDTNIGLVHYNISRTMRIAHIYFSVCIQWNIKSHLQRTRHN